MTSEDLSDTPHPLAEAEAGVPQLNPLNTLNLTPETPTTSNDPSLLLGSGLSISIPPPKHGLESQNASQPIPTPTPTQIIPITAKESPSSDSQKNIQNSTKIPLTNEQRFEKQLDQHSRKARRMARDALDVTYDLLKTGLEETTRLQAAKLLFDQAYGKPGQRVKVDGILPPVMPSIEIRVSRDGLKATAGFSPQNYIDMALRKDQQPNTLPTSQPSNPTEEDV